MPRIFYQICCSATRLNRKRVSVDMNTVYCFLGRRIFARLWANYRYDIVGTAKRFCYRPHPPIERNRKVLHYNQDPTWPHCAFTNRSNADGFWWHVKFAGVTERDLARYLRTLMPICLSQPRSLQAHIPQAGGYYRYWRAH